ncbi:i-AAA protease yme1 [Elasticomyces elasticus]|nr:i-AAA protease yme1 [Elasticomyces elasticus]KAK3657703.1 i-AAA protease yme1 [Elasticomyces elasticus]KAK4922508.1 i-AAA protease yme1 [Elasticomyces elasticus]
MADEKVKVLLFGLGAIGGFYAFIIGRNENVSLSVVARSNYEEVKKNASGLIVESENHGRHKVNIEHVLRSPADAETTFDYIVCANKAVDPDSVPPLLKPAVGEQTTFVIAQNGVGNEEPFRHHFPSNSIISCVIWVGAIQNTPGIIKHHTSENTQLGLFSNPMLDVAVEQHRLDQFATLFRNGGTGFEVMENVQVNKWEKVVWNVAWNSLTTLTGVDTQTWLKTPEAMSMTKRLMREVIDVARRCDVPLEHSLVDVHIERILAVPGIYSSMHEDSKQGRPLEVDVILGYPMKKAWEFGLDVPTLSAVYAMVMAVNGRILKSRQ